MLRELFFLEVPRLMSLRDSLRCDWAAETAVRRVTGPSVSAFLLRFVEQHLKVGTARIFDLISLPLRIGQLACPATRANEREARTWNRCQTRTEVCGWLRYAIHSQPEIDATA